MKKSIRKSVLITIVGVGGTGCHILSLISSIKLNLRIIDRDIVEESNLKRQILYSKKDLGMPKVSSAVKKLKLKKVKALMDDLTHKNADQLLKDSNIIIECTDNIYARLIINDYCKKNNIPWISTAAIENTGQILSIADADSPCYYCVFEEKYGDTCNHSNVNIKVLQVVAKKVKSIVNEFISSAKFDSKFVRISPDGTELNIKVKQNKNCPACKDDYQYLSGKKSRITQALCGNDRYIINLKKTLNLSNISKRVKGIRKINDQVLLTDDITLLSSGKVIIKASSMKEARKKFDREISI